MGMEAGGLVTWNLPAIEAGQETSVTLTVKVLKESGTLELQTIETMETSGERYAGEVHYITVIGANQPPTLSVLAPAPESRFTNRADVAVSLKVMDFEGEIDSVYLFDGRILVSQIPPPYTYVLTNRWAGDYKYTFVATDRTGLSSEAEVRFSVER